MAVLSGDGTSAYGVGEIWHLVNYRMKIPISLLDANNLNQGKLSKYNTLILADGSYSQLDSIDVNSLKDWIANGGTLISVQSASSWVVEDSLTDEHLLENQ